MRAGGSREIVGFDAFGLGFGFGCGQDGGVGCVCKECISGSARLGMDAQTMTKIPLHSDGFRLFFFEPKMQPANAPRASILREMQEVPL